MVGTRENGRIVGEQENTHVPRLSSKRRRCMGPLSLYTYSSRSLYTSHPLPLYVLYQHDAE